MCHGSAAKCKLVRLPTIPVNDGPGFFLRHVPDFRSFWRAAPHAWTLRDIQMVDLENQPHPNCHGTPFLSPLFDTWQIKESFCRNKLQSPIRQFNSWLGRTIFSQGYESSQGRLEFIATDAFNKVLYCTVPL